MSKANHTGTLTKCLSTKNELCLQQLFNIMQQFQEQALKHGFKTTEHYSSALYFNFKQETSMIWLIPPLLTLIKKCLYLNYPKISEDLVKTAKQITLISHWSVLPTD